MPSPKAAVLAMIGKMPDDATWAQIAAIIALKAEVEAGFAEIDSGQGIPHERFKQEMSEWLRSFGPSAPARISATPSDPSTAILT